jgi:hypothetical protein
MNAKDWRLRAAEEAAATAVDLTLPSGMTIRARRPDPLQMAMWRRLPLSLAATAAGETGSAMSPEELMESVEASRQMLLYCCVSPRISLEPVGDDEIHPRDIPLGDAVFILRWAMRSEEAEKLRPFRIVEGAGDGGGDGQTVRAAAERAAGDSGSAAGAGAGPGGGGGAAGGGPTRIAAAG